MYIIILFYDNNIIIIIMWYCYRAVYSPLFGTRLDVVLQRARDNIFFIIPFARRRRRRYLQQPRPFSADYYYLLRLIYIFLTCITVQYTNINYKL